MDGHQASEIGLGTHRIRGDLSCAIKSAVELGIRVIDTAPNYHDGEAQRAIGVALEDLIHPECSLSELRVSTKVGFIPRHATQSLRAYQVITEDDVIAGHCLTPQYLRWQVSRNTEMLGRIPTDTLFLHNPEIALRRFGSEFISGVLPSAFRECEDLRQKGQLQRYGISTWSGFFSILPPAQLARMVRDVAGEGHGFDAIQLPTSLVRCDELYRGLVQRDGPLVEARALGWKTFGSSPLHGGELISLVSPSLGKVLGSNLSPAQGVLNFLISTHLLDVILVSTGSREHLREALILSDVERLDHEVVKELLKRIVQQ